MARPAMTLGSTQVDQDTTTFWYEPYGWRGRVLGRFTVTINWTARRYRYDWTKRRFLDPNRHDSEAVTSRG